MIKANELRIGNWIEFAEESESCIVKGIDADGLGITVYFPQSEDETWIELNRFEPLPLSVKILEQYGFVRLQVIDRRNCYFNESGWGITKSDNKVGFLFILRCGYILENAIYHIHQLQNLFYALASDEMPFKTNG